MSPRPIPAAAPEQNAIIFFNAPPSSTPFTSFDVYILIFSDINASCTIFKIFWCFDAITSAVGIAIETSSAWLGPDNAPTFAVGISSKITSSNVSNVSFSKPFEHIIIGLFPTYSLYCLNVLLVNFDGVTCKIILLSLITSPKSVEHIMFSGNSTPGKNLHFLSLFIKSLSSSIKDHIFTLLPTFAKCTANATPQLPLPIIAIFINLYYLLYLMCPQMDIYCYTIR